MRQASKSAGMKSANFHGMKSKNLAEMKSASHAHRRDPAPARSAQGWQKSSPPHAGGGQRGGETQKKKPRRKPSRADGGASKQKAAASYSPALRRSTIGAAGLNFSVRDGKRWNPGAMATWICRAPWKWTRSSSATGGASRGKTGHAGRTGGAHKARRENLIRAGSFRAISSARLWRRRLYTCALSTS